MGGVEHDTPPTAPAEPEPTPEPAVDPADLAEEGGWYDADSGDYYDSDGDRYRLDESGKRVYY